MKGWPDTERRIAGGNCEARESAVQGLGTLQARIRLARRALELPETDGTRRPRPVGLGAVQVTSFSPVASLNAKGFELSVHEPVTPETRRRRYYAPAAWPCPRGGPGRPRNRP